MCYKNQDICNLIEALEHPLNLEIIKHNNINNSFLTTKVITFQVGQLFAVNCLFNQKSSYFRDQRSRVCISLKINKIKEAKTTLILRELGWIDF
jgi:hypothetical protein